MPSSRSHHSRRHPVMLLCQLLCCFVRENSMVSAKCFWEDIWKTSSDSRLMWWKKKKKKKAGWGLQSLQWCQKWRKTKHLGFSHHHSRELSIWGKIRALSSAIVFSFFNWLSHVLTKLILADKSRVLHYFAREYITLLLTSIKSLVHVSSHSRNFVNDIRELDCFVKTLQHNTQPLSTCWHWFGVSVD